MNDDLLLNHIDGRWVSSRSGRTRTNENPAQLSDVIGEFTESDGHDATTAVDAAAAALAGWNALGVIKRGEIVRRAASIIAERSEEFARAITREQGKRLSEARGEVSRSLAILEFTVGEARRMNGITTPADDPRTLAMTFRRPLGVVALISPWNFPLAIPVWKVAPALVAGCTAVLKPSPLTPLTSAMLVEAFVDAGVPSGVLNLVQGDFEPGEALVADERVRGVSFTGSWNVGRAINRAGADRLLRVQLELGGKNALIVLDDADLDKAVDAIVHGAFGQSGQRCSATSRVVVDRKVKDALLERLIPRVEGMRVGDGREDGVDIGPVVNADRLAACLAAVQSAARSGATIACGGSRALDGIDGHYVQPTVLVDVPWDSEIAQEEVFGPVLSVIDADGYDDAMRISNSVRYGMSGTIFTQNPSLMFQALNDFEAGMLHVNQPGVGAYAHMPHMGAKASQLGAPECSPDVWEFYTELRSAAITY
jgi:aldehyde dehydrogenase (NAD+)